MRGTKLVAFMSGRSERGVELAHLERLVVAVFAGAGDAEDVPVGPEIDGPVFFRVRAERLATTDVRGYRSRALELDHVFALHLELVAVGAPAMDARNDTAAPGVDGPGDVHATLCLVGIHPC